MIQTTEQLVYNALLTNRLAGMVEKESITGIIKNLINLVKEIQKL